MVYPPIIPKIQLPTKSNGEDAKAAEGWWPRFVAAITNSHFLGAVALCLIAFLLALNLILRFPDFGAVIEQYNQFWFKDLRSTLPDLLAVGPWDAGNQPIGNRADWVVWQAGQRTHRNQCLALRAQPIVGENSIGIRLACRSFHAATRRLASSRGLRLGRALCSRFLLGGCGALSLHLATIESQRGIVVGEMACQRQPEK
jgi:hypothetical protein